MRTFAIIIAWWTVLAAAVAIILGAFAHEGGSSKAWRA